MRYIEVAFIKVHSEFMSVPGVSSLMSAMKFKPMFYSAVIISDLCIDIWISVMIISPPRKQIQGQGTAMCYLIVQCSV